MKVAVVGGTGNISTSIVRVLLDQGHEVVCFNRNKRGHLPPGARLIIGDRKDRDHFEHSMRQHHFDAAIDMICFNAEDAQSSVRAFQGVGHFVQCSTVCTYGVEYPGHPVAETQPLRPMTSYGINKMAADKVFMTAWEHDQFPATIIKPSTTYGPQLGLLRQVAWEFGWIDRVRKGKPILVCNEGKARHQFLHVDDAAVGFAGVLTKPRCIGQTYNLVNTGFITWSDYHHTAMDVIGRKAELVSLSLQDLMRIDAARFDICDKIFAHHTHYCSEKAFRDIPEFKPRISLKEGMRQVIESLDYTNRIPNSDLESWEDAIIAGTSSITQPEVPGKSGG